MSLKRGAALRPDRRGGRADVIAAGRRRPHACGASRPCCRSTPASRPTDRLTFRLGLPGARYKGSEAAFRFLQRTGTPPGRGADDSRGGRHDVAAAHRPRRPPRRGDRESRGRARTMARRARIRAWSPATICRRSARACATGRGFLPSDTATSPPVAIVNETMAKRYWPGASAIGKRVRFTDQEIWREVVGIIGDVKHWGLDAPVNPGALRPDQPVPDLRADVRAARPTAIPSRWCRSCSVMFASSIRTCRCSRSAPWRKWPRNRSSAGAGR